MIGVIPLTLVSLYFNLLVGPAELAEVPEGYIPREWEYQQNAVMRFMARYVYPTPQKGYEQLLQNMYEQADEARVRRLEYKIAALQAERMDYQGYSFTVGHSAKFRERYKEINDTFQEESKNIFADRNKR